MGRPRKPTEEVWFDQFTDMSAEEQSAAIKILEALHRQKLRTKRANGKPGEEPTKLMFGDQVVEADGGK